MEDKSKLYDKVRNGRDNKGYLKLAPLAFLFGVGLSIAYNIGKGTGREIMAIDVIEHRDEVDDYLKTIK